MPKTSGSSKDSKSHSRQATSSGRTHSNHSQSRSRSRSPQSRAKADGTGSTSKTSPKASSSASGAGSKGQSQEATTSEQNTRPYKKIIQNKQFDPLLASRVFVGPLDPRPGIIDEDLLYDHFIRYGRITGERSHVSFSSKSIIPLPLFRHHFDAEIHFVS